MQRLVFFIAILLALVACTEVSFPTHQPRSITPLTEFPTELRGLYTTSDSDSLKDTLSIDPISYRFLGIAKQGGSNWLNNAELSDSLILKKYKGYYFINFKENGEWLLRVVKRESSGNLSFRMFAIDGAGKDKLLTELEKEIKVDVIQVSRDDKYYRIDPSPKKLIDLVRKKKYWEESKLHRLK